MRSEFAQQYTLLPEYLDSIVIWRGHSRDSGHRVSMPDSSRIPDKLFPSLRLRNELADFADELIQLVNGLQDQDFRAFDLDTTLEICHINIADMEKRRTRYIPKNLVRERFSASIQDKLKNKYQGSYDLIFLVFHNYGIGFTDKHFYWHDRNQILLQLAGLCWENQTFHEYDGVFFLDFTHYIEDDQFNLYSVSQHNEMVSIKIKSHHSHQILIPFIIDFSKEHPQLYVSETTQDEMNGLAGFVL